MPKTAFFNFLFYISPAPGGERTVREMDTRKQLVAERDAALRVLNAVEKNLGTAEYSFYHITAEQFYEMQDGVKKARAAIRVEKDR